MRVSASYPSLPTVRCKAIERYRFVFIVDAFFFLGETGISMQVPHAHGRHPPTLRGEKVPAVSYSSSEDEEFYDAHDSSPKLVSLTI